jgi:hypothetical protein
MSDLSDVDTARKCFLFLEEFIECIELRDKTDRQLCDVCKKKFAFHRRKNEISIISSDHLKPPTSSNNVSVLTTAVVHRRATNNALPALPSSSFSSSNSSSMDLSTELRAPLFPSNSQLLKGSMPTDLMFPSALSPPKKFLNFYDPEAFQISQQSNEKDAEVSLDDDSEWFSGFFDNVKSGGDVEEEEKGVDFYNMLQHSDGLGVDRIRPYTGALASHNLVPQPTVPSSSSDIGILLSSTSSDRCVSEVSSVTSPSLVSGATALLELKMLKKASGMSSKGCIKKEDREKIYDTWQPKVSDYNGFDVQQLAPDTIFYGRNQSFFNASSNKSLICEESSELNNAFSAAVAKIIEFQFALWPRLREATSCYHYKNSTRGRYYCLAQCGKNGEVCRFHVNLRVVKKSSVPAVKISSCYLTHDCQAGANVEATLSLGVSGQKRRRNHELKYVVHGNPVLSNLSHHVDLRGNDGIKCKQLIQSSDKCMAAPVLTVSQSKTYHAAQNKNNFQYHTRQFAQLADFYRRLQDADPQGLYVLNLIPVSYNLPGVPDSIRDSQLMFDWCLCISSACLTWWENGNKIIVWDGAHMYHRYEGVILTICAKDAEDHVIQIGFAMVPTENKYYWQEVFNAVFQYLRHHRMIMSDKAKGNLQFLFIAKSNLF